MERTTTCFTLPSGAEYLRGLGFPEEMTSFVRNHVDAKRFLVTMDQEYYQGE